MKPFEEILAINPEKALASARLREIAEWIARLEYGDQFISVKYLGESAGRAGFVVRTRHAGTNLDYIADLVFVDTWLLDAGDWRRAWLLKQLASPDVPAWLMERTKELDILL